MNGAQVELGPGEGIFVNAGRLHYGYSPRGDDCRFLVVAFHPGVVGGANPVVQASLREPFGPGAPDCLKLADDAGWQSRLLAGLGSLERDMAAEPPPFLAIAARVADLAAPVARHLGRYRISRACEMLRDTSRSVAEIALACGFQSASYFSAVFRRQTGAMPSEYRRTESLTEGGGPNSSR